jgi:hypothetical protein
LQNCILSSFYLMSCNDFYIANSLTS